MPIWNDDTTLHAVQKEPRCRFWRIGPARAATDQREITEVMEQDRRKEDRRGGGIRIFRFNNDRRAPVDRRGRIGRAYERVTVLVEGELRHQGVRYRIATADISERGASLLDAPALPVGSMVRLTLRPADDLAEYPMVLWAEVGSFCAERAMLGVRFVSPRDCDTRRLSRIVEAAAGRARDTSVAPYRF